MPAAFPTYPPFYICTRVLFQSVCVCMCVHMPFLLGAARVCGTYAVQRYLRREVRADPATFGVHQRLQPLREAPAETLHVQVVVDVLTAPSKPRRKFLRRLDPGAGGSRRRRKTPTIAPEE